MNKMLVSSTLLAVLVAVTMAYEFQDPTYNQLLISDMEELEEFISKHKTSPANVRDRRSTTEDDKKDDDGKDGHCRKHRMKFCCAEEQFQKLHSDKELELKKECYLEVNGPNATLPHYLSGNRDKDRDQRAPMDQFNPDKARKWKGDITCVSECVAKKKNLIDDKGEVIDAEIKKWAETVFTESYQKEILKTALPKCLGEARDKNLELPTYGHHHYHNYTQTPRPDGKVCSTAPLKFGFCLYREIQVNCPKDQIKNEETCAKVLEKIKQRKLTTPIIEH